VRGCFFPNVLSESAASHFESQAYQPLAETLLLLRGRADKVLRTANQLIVIPSKNYTVIAES
jgi:hypothetical protein